MGWEKDLLFLPVRWRTQFLFVEKKSDKYTKKVHRHWRYGNHTIRNLQMSLKISDSEQNHYQKIFRDQKRAMPAVDLQPIPLNKE